jgi:uncharacterized protein (TIGR00369 family)
MPDTTSPSGLLDIRRRLSGLEFFRKMIAGEVPPPPLVALLGLKLVEAEAGRVTFTGVAREEVYNGMGVAHGGFAATMLDSALGCAINTAMPAGRVFTTIDLQIHYTRALRREAGELRCTATVVHVGSRTATSEGRIVDANGTVYAHGTTTCMLVEPPRGE